MTDKTRLTTTAGAPVVSNETSRTAGPRGPLLIEDYQLIEKLAHQNRERIPERVVHAKGWGAQGTFTVTHDITRHSCAKLFAEVGKQTEVLARWSTVAGELGAADTERDVRGFSLKFYTEDGNWDMVGNNTRLGTHYEALPANVPKAASVQHYHKDGAMRFFSNDFGNPDAYYEPNQYGGPVAGASVEEPTLSISGDADRYKQEDSDADYVQPRALYNLFDTAQKSRLYANYAAAMGPCSKGVKERWYAVLERVHPEYAAGVREANERMESDVNAVPVTGDTPVDSAAG
jgi:catalase